MWVDNSVNENYLRPLQARGGVTAGKVRGPFSKCHALGWLIPWSLACKDELTCLYAHLRKLFSILIKSRKIWEPLFRKSFKNKNVAHWWGFLVLGSAAAHDLERHDGNWGLRGTWPQSRSPGHAKWPWKGLEWCAHQVFHLWTFYNIRYLLLIRFEHGTC